MYLVLEFVLVFTEAIFCVRLSIHWTTVNIFEKQGKQFSGSWQQLMDKDGVKLENSMLQMWKQHRNQTYGCLNAKPAIH